MLHPPLRTRVLVVVLTTSALLLTAAPSRAAEGIDSASAAAQRASPTKFGQCIQTRRGETWPQARQRVERAHGHLDAVRLFDAEPGAWTTERWSQLLGRRTGVINFKFPPREILKGTHDHALRVFFRSAPRGRPTYWSYFHEPDVAHAQGRLADLRQYRAAFAHVARLARRVDNPGLKTTLILFGYSANPQAKRSITDYWPGRELTDVIAWDIYNGWATEQGTYGGLEQIAHAREAARKVGKPWGIAEFGSVRLKRDDGSGRAAWITRMSRYASEHGAKFAMYFDAVGPEGTDYRLTDKPSRRAWRNVLDGRSV
ncbi:MAG TPA: hypothetical protein VFR07_08475 [Mycobacteriales bacterium]|jgi:hypothetical protein|nr:hypothetical protein [Mycobacteriales bacterium]